MMIFEYILNTVEENNKELQIEDFTSLEKKGQKSNCTIFYSTTFLVFSSVISSQSML